MVGGGHVFISYKRGSDSAYVRLLAEHLTAADIPVWYDYEAAVGAQWTKVIEEKIDTCAAFIVVMTPDANDSNWVEREINQAEHAQRVILPLLLRGSRFFSLGHLEYEDVTAGQMPTPGFIERVRNIVTVVSPAAPEEVNRWITLRNDILALIDKTIQYVGEARQLAAIYSALGDFSSYEVELVLRREMLTRMELQLAFVGPSKAGTSTIINAIAGRSILHRRSDRPSAIPTRIILAEDVEEPVLTIHDEDVAVLNDAIEKLGQAIDQEHIEPDFLKRHPRYAFLLRQIHDGELTPVRPQYSGEKIVPATLDLLHDLVLLAEYCYPQIIMSRMKTIPLIRTPQRAVRGLEALNPLGTLTIVDMPGIVENGDAGWLTSVLERELRSTDVTVVVLDYTQMGSDVLPDIRAVATADVAWSNLFALVNKVDERHRSDDPDVDETRRIAEEILAYLDAHQTKVLEISGLWAWVSSAALRALDEVAKAAASPLLELARLVDPLGDDDEWNEWVQHTKRVRKAAERSWHRSGTLGLLTEAVAHLNSVTVPATVSSSLSYVESTLQSLHARMVTLPRGAGSAAPSADKSARQLVAAIRKDLAAITAMRRVLP